MDLSAILGGVIPQLPSLPSVGMHPTFPSSGGPGGFSKMLPSILGAGAGILGNYLKTRQDQGPAYANLAQHQHEFDIQHQDREAEIARRNSLFQLAMPGLLRNMGYGTGSIPSILGANNG